MITILEKTTKTILIQPSENVKGHITLNYSIDQEKNKFWINADTSNGYLDLDSMHFEAMYHFMHEYYMNRHAEK